MNRDLDFLYEVGCLRFLQRNWRQFLNFDFQNVAEHTMRVMWIALIIAKRERADQEKIVKMALVHDVSESRTGDLHYVSREYSARNEQLAIDDILQGTSLDGEFKELFREYEEKKTLEAKIVKDADSIDVDLELQEQEAKGGSLKIYWKDMRKTVYENLFTKTAKKLWKEIQVSNPHDWHFKARNRFTKGDWKKGSK